MFTVTVAVAVCVGIHEYVSERKKAAGVLPERCEASAADASKDGWERFPPI
jgi:hypothetical protein